MDERSLTSYNYYYLFAIRWRLPPGGSQSKGPTGITLRAKTRTSQTGSQNITTGLVK